MDSRKSIKVLFVWLCLSSVLFAAPSFQRDEQNDENGAAAEKEYEVSLAGFEDAGVYHLYMKGTSIGTMRYERTTTGEVNNIFTIAMGGQTLEVTTRIYPDDQGAWKRMETRSVQGNVDVEREGCLVTRSILGNKSTLAIKSDSLIYDNNITGLLSDVIRRAEANGGDQGKVSMFSPTSVVFNATVKLESEEERAVAGRDVRFKKYLLAMPGVDTWVWTDADGRVMLFDIPMQNAYFVREGFEALTRKEIDDPLLSKPTFAVSAEKNRMVPMRDKVRLATDLYLPESKDQVPLILIRTPYGKQMSEMEGNYWARRGYACAIQDCRGRFNSEGSWAPFFHEPEDGYDTIEALAVEPWCSGKVGMIGGSYVGWVQWWAASLKPPHLVTIIPNVSPPDPHYNIPFEYGAFFLVGSIWWANILETEATADLTGRFMREVNETNYSKLLNTLPVIDLDKAILGAENPYWRSWIQNHEDESFWKKANFLEKLKKVDLPVFHQSGWFDGDSIGSKLNYLKMHAAGHQHQKLIIGPWGHTDTASRMIGDRDFTNEAVIDLQREYIRWFDYWLKGVDNKITEEPLVRMFTMGSNRWHKGNTYPLEQTEFRKLYLASIEGANTSLGDGTLVWEAGKSVSQTDTFAYNPGDPTPDPEFYPTQSKEEREKEVVDIKKEVKKALAYHQEITDRRKDILVYRTPPLEEPLTVCGPLSAVLYAASSAKDTDWFVTLCEERSGGKIFTLATGKVRARYRKSPFKAELLEPGQVYPYHLDLWHTGITFPEGSRIRVEVASAKFPMFSRNLNTGGHNEMEIEFVKADQKIYHNEEYPSHVLLPVIPEEK